MGKIQTQRDPNLSTLRNSQVYKDFEGHLVRTEPITLLLQIEPMGIAKKALIHFC
jgi:hypothetical protein